LAAYAWYDAMRVSTFSGAEIYPEWANRERPVYPALYLGWKRNLPFGFLLLIQQQGIEIKKQE